MEIHKPKPTHNWREFLSEIAVVVLGVVIALTAEQIVQRLEMRAKVHHAEELMRFEFESDDGPQVYERLALSPCIDMTLSDIRNGVQNNQQRTIILQAISQFDPPRHTWDSIAFQEASVTNILAEFPQRSLWRWAALYSLMPLLDRANEREFFDVARLRSLSEVGGPLTDTERSALLQAVEVLRRDNAEILAGVTHANATMRDLGVRVDGNVKTLVDTLSPGGQGPSRVIDELRHLPMAAACLPTLEKMMAVKQ